jgi:hypothetical protein
MVAFDRYLYEESRLVVLAAGLIKDRQLGA